MGYNKKIKQKKIEQVKEKAKKVKPPYYIKRIVYNRPFPINIFIFTGQSNFRYFLKLILRIESTGGIVSVFKRQKNTYDIIYAKDKVILNKKEFWSEKYPIEEMRAGNGCACGYKLDKNDKNTNSQIELNFEFENPEILVGIVKLLKYISDELYNYYKKLNLLEDYGVEVHEKYIKSSEEYY